MILIRVRDYRYYSISKYIKPVIHIVFHSHLCTEQLINKHISVLSKLQESAEISAVRFTNLNGIVCVYVIVLVFSRLTENLTHTNTQHIHVLPRNIQTRTQKKWGGRGYKPPEPIKTTHFFSSKKKNYGLGGGLHEP